MKSNFLKFSILLAILFSGFSREIFADKPWDFSYPGEMPEGMALSSAVVAAAGVAEMSGLIRKEDAEYSLAASSALDTLSRLKYLETMKGDKCANVSVAISGLKTLLLVLRMFNAKEDLSSGETATTLSPIKLPRASLALYLISTVCFLVSKDASKKDKKITQMVAAISKVIADYMIHGKSFIGLLSLILGIVDVFGRDILKAEETRKQKEEEEARRKAMEEAERKREEEDVCTICLEKNSLGIGRMLDCGHKFHDDCIKPWIGESKTCPLCRSIVMDLD